MSSSSTLLLSQSWPGLVQDKYRSTAELIAKHDWSWWKPTTNTVGATYVDTEKLLVDYQLFLLCKVVFDDWKLADPNTHGCRFKISPTSEVDKLWHAHMLHPMNYARLSHKVLSHWFRVIERQRVTADDEEEDLLMIDHSPSFADDTFEMKLRRQLQRMQCIHGLILTPSTTRDVEELTEYRKALVREEKDLHQLMVMALESSSRSTSMTASDIVVTDKDDEDVVIDVEIVTRQPHQTPQAQSVANKRNKIPRSLPPNHPITVVIKTITGKSVPLEPVLPHETTVLRLKELYQDKEGVPPDQSILFFGGGSLQNDRLLSDYGIYEDCEIMNMLNLRGC